jgi:hypothetical protein
MGRGIDEVPPVTGKHEIRITKLETNYNDQNTNDQNTHSPLLSEQLCFEFLNLSGTGFEHSDFEYCFGF